MPFTLWSNSQLLGETDFALTSRNRRKRIGVFHPSPTGLAALEPVTDMAPALFRLHARMKREGIDVAKDADAERGLELFKNSPEGQRVIECAKHVAALELRDPEGVRLPCAFIAVNDLEHLAALAGAVRTCHTVPGAVRRHDGEAIRFLISITLERDSALSGLRAPFRSRRKRR